MGAMRLLSVLLCAVVSMYVVEVVDAQDATPLCNANTQDTVSCRTC